MLVVNGLHSIGPLFRQYDRDATLVNFGQWIEGSLEYGCGWSMLYAELVFLSASGLVMQVGIVFFIYDVIFQHQFVINYQLAYIILYNKSIYGCLVVRWVWFEVQNHWPQQLLNVFLELKMEGEQLPKATMNTYLKQHTRTPYSNDYLLKMLYIAKEFIARIADKSNIMCQTYHKKTINTQHLDAALRQLGLINHLHDLKHIEETIKEHNILKRQASQRMEEMIARDKQEERERRKNEEMAKKEVTVREKFDELEKHQLEGEEQVDYQNLQDDEVEIIEKMQ